MDTQSLVEARLQIHYAIQFAAASAAALIAPEADFSHTALSWNTENQRFQTQPIEAAQRIRIILDPIELNSLITDNEGNILASFPLVGKTMAEGFTELRSHLSAYGIDGTKILPAAYPTYDFPFHPLALGLPFTSEGVDARAALIHYYQSSFPAFLRVMNSAFGIASDRLSLIRVWPHHFDMAVLLTFDGEKSIGIGLSPGDRHYAQPYWYVYAYPYPDITHLPALTLGAWHTQEWIGTVLTAEDMGKTVDAEKVDTFLTEAIKAAKSALEIS